MWTVESTAVALALAWVAFGLAKKETPGATKWLLSTGAALVLFPLTAYKRLLWEEVCEYRGWPTAVLLNSAILAAASYLLLAVDLRFWFVPVIATAFTVAWWFAKGWIASRSKSLRGLKKRRRKKRKHPVRIPRQGIT